jgi:hypothetical protein
MTTLSFHHDYAQLPPATESHIPVHLYGLGHHSREDISLIGHPLIEKIKRLGVQLPELEMDFLTIALAVTAADTFVHRADSEDGWTRSITLHIPLWSPEPWKKVQAKLEKALHFLSGDLWNLKFTDGGFISPQPYQRKDRFEIAKLKDIDCVSLLSGGLDSAIGAIDLLESGKKPLFISHAYRGDKTHQQLIIDKLTGNFWNFSVNADPHLLPKEKNTEISMRTRSLNFIAFAIAGASAVNQVNQIGVVPLVIPENGLISINAPLTSRRIGSLSTRTTHPHYINSLQDIFSDVGISVRLINPYQFLTKGEMVKECKNQNILKDIIELTVSCSHWKRENKQCGCCLPCLIRRSAISKGGFTEYPQYVHDDLKSALVNENAKDDLFALMGAIAHLKDRNIVAWIRDSGPLPINDIDQFKDTFVKGLKEVEQYLIQKGVL